MEISPGPADATTLRKAAPQRGADAAVSPLKQD